MHYFLMMVTQPTFSGAESYIHAYIHVQLSRNFQGISERGLNCFEQKSGYYCVCLQTNRNHHAQLLDDALYP